MQVKTYLYDGGSTAWTYDSRRRMLTETKTVNGAGTFNTSTSYDAADRVRSLTYPTGEVITQAYSARGLLNGVKSQSNSQWLASNLAYNANGSTARIDFGNSLSIRYYYFALDTGTYWGSTAYGRLRQACVLTTTLGDCADDMRSGSSQTLYNMTYWYDNAGNVQLMNERTPNFNGLQTYQYDPLDRLTHAYSGASEANPYDETYAYNAIGNLTSRTGIGSYTYGDAAHKHAVTVAGNYTYTYDLNGNMITRTQWSATWAQTWDVDNHVSQMTSSGGATATYVYDGDGKRVKRIENGITTTVFIGGIYEKNLSSTLTTTYYFAGSKRIAMNRGGTLYFEQGDQLGSISLTTDRNGTPIISLRYSAYGGTRAWVGAPVWDDEAIGFTHQLADRADGWIYNYGARFYDPYIGRFISADTVVPQQGNPQSLNRYAYTYNNPLRYVDSSGHCGTNKADEECRELEEQAKERFGVDLSTNFDKDGIVKFIDAMEILSYMVGGDAVSRYLWKGTTVVIWEGEAAATIVCRGPTSCEVGDSVNLYLNDLNTRALSTLAHELAHVWDFRTRAPTFLSKNAAHYGITAEMASVTHSRPCKGNECEGPGENVDWVVGPFINDGPLNTYARHGENGLEDWSMSFELWVSQDKIRGTYSEANLSVRYAFVSYQVAKAQRYAPRR